MDFTVEQRRARLVARHHLDGSAASAVEATRDLVVLHATDPATVYLSLLARCPDLSLKDISRVLYDERALVRSDQVRCSWRATQAVNSVFHRSGGAALRMDKPLQRFWRDANASLTHAVNMPGLTYQISALSQLGVPPAPGSIL